MERTNSSWARSLFVRLVCCPIISSVFVCGLAELCLWWWPPASWRHYERIPLQAHFRLLVVIAPIIFWITFVLAGLMLGFKEVITSFKRSILRRDASR